MILINLSNSFVKDNLMSSKINFSPRIIKIRDLTCTIICANSQEFLKEYKNSADLIVTSPPYADARKKHYDSIEPDKYCEWFLNFNESFYNSLKPQGSFVLNIKDKVVDGVRHRYVWDTVKALSQKGWFAIDDYIWHKTNPMPGYWPNRLSDGWEYCFHLAKSRNPYFNSEEIKKPIGDWVETRLKNLSETDQTRHNSSNESGFGRDISKWVGKKKVLPSNVISLALVGKNKGHPAVFPIDLPLFFIKLLCPPKGVVIDPFAGSGTTGIAALMSGRNCLLIDNSEEYCLESFERIKSETISISKIMDYLPGLELDFESNRETGNL
jgi:site-specific DNA-methyltransferase (adenine-specific)